jgi:hypothetical protein
MTTPSKIAALVVVLLLLSYVALVIAENRRIGRNQRAANEYAAASRLGKLNKLQLQYRTAHPELGFACRLSELGPLDKELALRSFYEDGRLDGYVFSLAGCESAKPNRRYSLIAVPMAAGASGRFSYCTDESGTIFRDKDPSGQRCLSSRTPLD